MDCASAIACARWVTCDGGRGSSRRRRPALADAARTFAANENRIVRVVAQEGERQTVEVTPRAWSGRGLVGCHMRSV